MTGPKDDKVVVENPNVPGSTSRVDAVKYEAMRDALLLALPATTPGLTQAEMREAGKPFRWRMP